MMFQSGVYNITDCWLISELCAVTLGQKHWPEAVPSVVANFSFFIVSFLQSPRFITSASLSSLFSSIGGLSSPGTCSSLQHCTFFCTLSAKNTFEFSLIILHWCNKYMCYPYNAYSLSLSLNLFKRFKKVKLNSDKHVQDKHICSIQILVITDFFVFIYISSRETNNILVQKHAITEVNAKY